MDIIIMAAGRGKRLGLLTQNTPKPLIKIAGKTLLEYKLNALPPAIEKIILVVGYRAQQIQEKIGNTWNNTPITYIVQDEITGTASALRAAEKAIRSETFLVLNGDDIYGKNDLEEIIKHPLAFGVQKNQNAWIEFGGIETDEKNIIKNLYDEKEASKKMENATPVGCYVLNKKIFTIPPVKIKSGEFGLPQTILEFSKENPVPTIEIKFWLPINSLSHLRQAEEILQKSNQHRFVVGDESSYTQEQ